MVFNRRDESKDGYVIASRNLFAGLPAASEREHTDDLLRAGSVRIERIVSHGQASAPGFWYDQDWDEWVVLLAGSALLRLAEEDEARTLAVGDHLHIPAHVRHRVEWTDPRVPTVWLAVHIHTPSAA
jgi:cupin 2 domain-containing protein